ncbi:putative sugar phosphate/phosphate translocator [Abeliophyllum distichum]|uniref:Sugar phosphate/phosphate translocator n=1 Tax=Abeliophyllum distichum TaxID=126358 RepID=A0ABD1UMK7_9LAMI
MAIQLNLFQTSSLNYAKQPRPFSSNVPTRLSSLRVNAISGKTQELLQSGTVRPILPKDAASATESEGYILQDIRPQWEREKARVLGSLHVPLFVEDKDNGPLTLLKKWVHFGYIGLWTGQYFTMINDDFIKDVENEVPDKDSKLLVACGEGLRLFYCYSKMSATKSSGRFFTIGLVASWYSSNIGVLLLNKYLLSNYGFKYPIFLTMCHMTACSLLSYIAIVWMKMVPMQTIRSRVQFMKISALSLIFCASVVSGNISLRYLPVSFNQAIGATTPFFTAVFAYLMTLKREAWLTYVTLIPVVTGVVIASGGEPSFHLFGFIVCVGATAARALKSVVQGILLSSEGEKLNSMNLLMYMAPIAVVLLLPTTLLMEENVVGITLALARDDIRIVWFLLFNSALAYFVNLTNFLVTKHTSALTLQVLGNAKGAVAVVISILIFRNPVSVTGMLGYTLTVIGVILYSEAKKRGK